MYKYLYAFGGPGSHNKQNFIHPPASWQLIAPKKAAKITVYTYMNTIQQKYMQKCTHKYPQKAKSGGQARVGGWYGIPRDYRPFKCHSREYIMMGKDDSSQKSIHKQSQKSKNGGQGDRLGQGMKWDSQGSGGYQILQYMIYSDEGYQWQQNASIKQCKKSKMEGQETEKGI